MTWLRRLKLLRDLKWPSLQSRYFCDVSSDVRKSFFISTPIFYVNGAPHIGHYYTAVLADALHRYHLLRYKECKTIFSTGTDEHGLKIQQASAANSTEPLVYCDRISSQFKAMCKDGSIMYTDFIRTTEERHKNAVHKFWKTLESGGHIYKGEYQGWYCVSDESFLSEKQVTEVKDSNNKLQKVSLESGNPVEWMTEENYMFKLSKFKNDILHWLGPDDSTIRPKKFSLMIRQWLEDDLPDISVSRQKSRLEWGIPVPGDSTQTIYVWLDALVNYLTVAGYPENPGYKWPPDCQVIGKDILKFHAVYWPAFLIAAGIEPPKSIFCHCHWTVGGEKMSKSKGNVVDPIHRINRLTCDGLRYFLLARGVPHNDGNFNDEKVVELLNSELMGCLGNLLHRVTAPALNPMQTFPVCDPDLFDTACGQDGRHLVDAVMALPDAVDGYYEEYNVYKAVQDIMNCLRMSNMLIQNSSPWSWQEGRNMPEKAHLLHTFLHTMLETLRVCSILMQPVFPSLSTEVLKRLSIPETERTIGDLKCFTNLNSKEKAVHEGRSIVHVKRPLFDKIKIYQP